MASLQQALATAVAALEKERLKTKELKKSEKNLKQKVRRLKSRNETLKQEVQHQKQQLDLGQRLAAMNEDTIMRYRNDLTEIEDLADYWTKKYLEATADREGGDVLQRAMTALGQEHEQLREDYVEKTEECERLVTDYDDLNRDYGELHDAYMNRGVLLRDCVNAWHRSQDRIRELNMDIEILVADFEAARSYIANWAYTENAILALALFRRAHRQ